MGDFQIFAVADAGINRKQGMGHDAVAVGDFVLKPKPIGTVFIMI
jgi:hypothetical protein